MNKQFVDINNLQIVWDEINDKFARMTDLEQATANLSVSYFSQNEFNDDYTPEFHLKISDEPIQIPKEAYDYFINFVNSNKCKKIVIDDDGIDWNVISSTLFDNTTENGQNIEEVEEYTKQKFNGVIVASNNIPDVNSQFDNLYLIYAYSFSGHYYIEWVSFCDQYANHNDLNSLKDSIIGSSKDKYELTLYGVKNLFIEQIKQVDNTIAILNSQINSLDDNIKGFNKILKSTISDLQNNYVTLNEFNNLKEDYVDHVKSTNKIIQDLTARIERLEESNNTGSDDTESDNDTTYNVEVIFHNAEGDKITNINNLNVITEEMVGDADRYTVFKNY